MIIPTITAQPQPDRGRCAVQLDPPPLLSYPQALVLVERLRREFAPLSVGVLFSGPPPANARALKTVRVESLVLTMAPGPAPDPARLCARLRYWLLRAAADPVPLPAQPQETSV